MATFSPRVAKLPPLTQAQPQYYNAAGNISPQLYSYTTPSNTPTLASSGLATSPSLAGMAAPTAAPIAAPNVAMSDLGGGGGVSANVPTIAADYMTDPGLSGGMPADLGGPPADIPGLGGPPSGLSGQSPGLAALQGLLGRSTSGVQSPGLQSLLEGTAGRLGGQARQRYGRQFQTFLANQRAAQNQRGAETAGMDQGGPASALQGQMQMQMALDRLRAALDMPSREPQRNRAPQFASSASALGGGLTATSPYLY